MTEGKERRSFYRVDDTVILEYRQVSADELVRQGIDQGAPRPPRTAMIEQFSNINRHLAPILGEIRRDEPHIAQYLEALNKKIDLLASNVHVAGALGDDGIKMESITTAANLSEGGMAFSCKAAIGAQSYLHVRVTSKISGVILETYARVIAVDRDARANAKLPYKLRVEFPYLDDTEKKQLIKHLRTLQREELRRRNQDS
ncbi:MAG: PilZ domain-containing protein [Pseudomonadota bacterium]